MAAACYNDSESRRIFQMPWTCDDVSKCPPNTTNKGMTSAQNCSMAINNTCSQCPVVADCADDDIKTPFGTTMCAPRFASLCRKSDSYWPGDTQSLLDCCAGRTDPKDCRPGYCAGGSKCAALYASVCPKGIADPACLEWCRQRPASAGTCDKAMTAYCAANPTDPYCACMASPLNKYIPEGNPLCYDLKCNEFGYVSKNMTLLECPDTIICSQVIGVDGQGNLIKDIKLDQSCTQTDTPVPDPDPPTPDPKPPGSDYSKLALAALAVILLVILVVLAVDSRSRRASEHKKAGPWPSAYTF